MLKVKIKKILVPIDGSKSSFKGLNQAIYLARQCGATLTGFYVVPIYPSRFGDILEPFKKEAFKQAKKIMGEAKTISAQNGIVFNEKIVYGEVKWDIVDFAHGQKFDLIVIGSHGFGQIKEMFLGSVANYVAHKSKIPVLVVK